MKTVITALMLACIIVAQQSAAQTPGAGFIGLPEDIQCRIGGVLDGIVGSPETTNGNISHLECRSRSLMTSGKPIALVDGSVKKSVVQTREFGAIEVFSGPRDVYVSGIQEDGLPKLIKYLMPEPTTPSQDELNAAAASGDVARVTTSLAAGADVNASRPDGVNALILAVYDDRPEVVRALLAAHADASAKTPDGISALMWAAFFGRTEMARALIGAGADVNAAQVADGSTALILATRHRNLDMVKLLVEAKADVNAKTTGGDTALTIATKSRFVEIVKVLSPPTGPAKKR